MFIIIYSNSNFEIICGFCATGGRRGVSVVVIGDSAGLVPNAATSGHDTCVFSLGFLAELLFDLVGTFTGRSMRVRSF